MTIAWEAAGATHVGRLRDQNEDSFRLDAEHGVFLVADGMGGHAAGEVASALAADAAAQVLREAAERGVPRHDLPLILQLAADTAHQRISDHCREDPRTRGMGTTLTACVLTPEGACGIVHIGDSRLYRLRAGRLEQLTHDHTWVQREVDAGRLSPAAARRHPLSHVLSRVLSDDLAAEADVLEADVAPDDLLLLATDGLYNMVEDPAIAALLGEPLPLAARVDGLVDAANQAGGADNVTVVAVRIREA